MSDLEIFNKQINEIMKVGLQKWLLTYRVRGAFNLGWGIHDEMMDFYELYDKSVTNSFYSDIYTRKKKLDEMIDRSNDKGTVSDNLYKKWEEIRDEEREKEDEEENMRLKEVEAKTMEKEIAMNEMIERLIPKVLLMHLSINN